MENNRSNRLMGRVLRMSSAVPSGDKILRFIRTPETRKLLVEAAESGQPPVGAISQKLAELIGTDILSGMLVKQFCGLATRAVLAEEGFVPTQLGVRLRADPVFTSGTVYARRLDMGPRSDERLLKRMIDTLSLEEMRWVASYIAQRIDAPVSTGTTREIKSGTKSRPRRQK